MYFQLVIISETKRIVDFIEGYLQFFSISYVLIKIIYSVGWLVGNLILYTKSCPYSREVQRKPLHDLLREKVT